MNEKTKKIIVIIAGVLATIYIVSISTQKYQKPGGIAPTVTLANQLIQVEIADTPTTQQQGLMFRKSLGKNAGMLFVFSTNDYHTFWMKNTLIPLDIIWIDQNYKIVDIKKNVQPCTTEICDYYMPHEPSKYVLELNGGWSEKNGLAIGEIAKITL